MQMNKIIILLTFLLFANEILAAEIPGIYEYLAVNDPYREPGLIYTIDNCDINRDNYFYCTFHNNRDFKNRFVFGRFVDNKISNTIYELSDIEYVAIIDSVRFLDIDKTRLLKIYISNKKGNGNINIYKIENSALKKVFIAHAIDSNAEMEEKILTTTGNIVDFNWDNPSQNPKGQVVQFSLVFQDSHLKSRYLDLNNDGFEDLILEGYIQTKIENEDSDIISQKEIHLKRSFLWNKKILTFIENKKDRIGPSYYFSTIDEN